MGCQLRAVRQHERAARDSDRGWRPCLCAWHRRHAGGHQRRHRQGSLEKGPRQGLRRRQWHVWVQQRAHHRRRSPHRVRWPGGCQGHRLRQGERQGGLAGARHRTGDRHEPATRDRGRGSAAADRVGHDRRHLPESVSSRGRSTGRSRFASASASISRWRRAARGSWSARSRRGR